MRLDKIPKPLSFDQDKSEGLRKGRSWEKGGVFKMADIEKTGVSNRKKLSINERLFRLPAPGEEPHLIGVKCKNCGELFFPERTRCTNCFAEEMEQVALSKKGKIYTYTIVHHATPGYTGPTPYAVGAIELPEGIVILSPLAQFNFEKLKIGMEVELAIEKLYENEKGDEIFSYKFGPR
jgi:uncharacterized OB-fold protein